jgi:hypothetical protein
LDDALSNQRETSLPAMVLLAIFGSFMAGYADNEVLGTIIGSKVIQQSAT